MSSESGTEVPLAQAAGSAAHVFVEDLDQPTVPEVDLHHLTGVLRLRRGEAVTVSDGAGRWRRCVWRGRSGELEPDGPVLFVQRPEPAVCIGFSLTKGDRPERIVRGLTEVGVDRIIPMPAIRSVVRWAPERAPAHLAGLRRVARGAAMQSRRVWLPEVAPLTALGDLLASLRTPTAALAQPGGSQPSLARPCILVGPEGGWDPSELGFGLPLVRLGVGVMRSETAALAGGVILCALRAGVVEARERSRP